MKLLHIIGSIDPETGGTYEGLVRTCETMLSLGVDVDVASLDPPGLFDELAEQLKFTFHAIGAEQRTYYGYSKRSIAWLMEHVTDYEAVIVHGLWQFHSHAASVACRQKKVPYFVFSHGMLDPWFNRNNRLKQLKKQIYWLFREYKVVRHATSMLFTADEERRLARKSFIPYSCTETVVGYGTLDPKQQAIKLTQTNTQSETDWEERPYILFISRIHPKKGLELLLAAYAQIKEQEPNCPELVIAGTAHEPSYLEELQKIYPQSGVHWVGHIDGERKWQALRNAEAMILVSHQENFGIVVAESLAVGTPVLISNKVNIWREIEAGACGFIEEDNLAGAQKLISRWVNTGVPERTRMSEAAIQTFQKQFDISSSTQRIIELAAKAQSN